MNTICLIVKFQGFHVGETFYARELGYAAVTSPDCGYMMFDLSPVASTVGLKAVSYTRRCIHGLPMMPRRGERALPHDSIYMQLARLYARYSTPGREVIAYQGGAEERDVLHQLGIPSMNVDDIGCPAVKLLQQMYGRELASCGLHDEDLELTRDRVPCAMGHVKLLRTWILDNSASKCSDRLVELEEEQRRIERRIEELVKNLDCLRSTDVPSSRVPRVTMPFVANVVAYASLMCMILYLVLQ